MPWETITASQEDIAAEIASFESGVTSIDNYSVAGHGHNQVSAVIEYTS